jgi:hypothetical protein
MKIKTVWVVRDKKLTVQLHTASVNLRNEIGLTENRDAASKLREEEVEPTMQLVQQTWPEYQWQFGTSYPYWGTIICGTKQIPPPDLPVCPKV